MVVFQPSNNQFQCCLTSAKVAGSWSHWVEWTLMANKEICSFRFVMLGLSWRNWLQVFAQPYLFLSFPNQGYSAMTIRSPPLNIKTGKWSALQVCCKNTNPKCKEKFQYIISINCSIFHANSPYFYLNINTKITSLSTAMIDIFLLTEIPLDN